MRSGRTTSICPTYSSNRSGLRLAIAASSSILASARMSVSLGMVGYLGYPLAGPDRLQQILDRRRVRVAGLGVADHLVGFGRAVAELFEDGAGVGFVVRQRPGGRLGNLDGGQERVLEDLAP